MDFGRIREADRRISEIGNSFAPAISPANLDAERAKSFDDESYNPLFEYAAEPDQKRLCMELERIETDSSPIGRLLEEKKQEYMLQLQLLGSVAKDSFTRNSILCFGCPSQALGEFAEEFIRKNQGRLDSEELDKDEIVPSLNSTLRQFGLDWSVEERDMVIKASVYHFNKKLFINKNIRVTRDLVTRLIAHEIGTHVLRAENGRNQELMLFFDGFPNYAMTEEGLAVINEQLCGLSKTDLLKMYAGRVIAIRHALRSSFSDTYIEMRKYFPKAEAWAITARAKRGLRDTSAPGAYTKDYLYLKGYLTVIDYLEKGGDLYDLYYGKIGVEHAAIIKKIPNLQEPKYLPATIRKPRAKRNLSLLSFF